MSTTPTPAPTSREAVERLAERLEAWKNDLRYGTHIAGADQDLHAAATLLALLDRAEAAEAENLRNREWARAAEESCLADRAALATAERERDEARKKVAELHKHTNTVCGSYAKENQRLSDERDATLAALQTAEGALASVREAILDCRDRAMFSSKEIVVKHVAERLPSINAALAEIRKALPWRQAMTEREKLLDFAVSRWRAEVANRPLKNIHRRALDDTWRQVIRYAGGEPEALIGPSHDELLAMKGQSHD